MSRDRLSVDLNNPVFQAHLFRLTKEDQHKALLTLEKLFGMTWDQVYRDAGLNWERIRSSSGSEKLYSLRMSKRLRAVAARDGKWLRLVSLHPDHDSAYKR